MQKMRRVLTTILTDDQIGQIKLNVGKPFNLFMFLVNWILPGG
jgi:hypothetical protein